MLLLDQHPVLTQGSGIESHPELPAGTVTNTREKAMVESRDLPSTVTDRKRSCLHS